jgi:hypothetical protein
MQLFADDKKNYHSCITICFSVMNAELKGKTGSMQIDHPYL